MQLALAGASAPARRCALTAGSLIGIGCLLALATLLLLGSPAQADLPASPNVLFIVTDDQPVDDTMAAMPKTSAWFNPDPQVLGATDFANAFVTTPLCCPSRASIFTGRYAHNHGVRTNTDASQLGTSPDSQGQKTTLQYYLTQSGYLTGIFGKYLNGWGITTGVPPPYFDKFSIWDSGNPHASFNVDEQGTVKTVYQYETSYVASQAVNFLSDAQQNDPARPWFLYLAPTIPHDLFIPEPRYANASVPPFQPPSSYFESDRRDKPFTFQKSITDPGDVRATATTQERMLISVDDLVDTVMSELTQLGEADNTLVILMSDNGFQWGEHGLLGKNRPYNESIKVPFFMRWPAANVGTPTDPRLSRTDTRPVANIDMAPTVLDALHIAPDPLFPPDGMSLLDPTQRRNRILTEGLGQSRTNPGLLFSSINTPTFQYTEYYSGDTSTPLNDYADPGSTIPAQDDGTPQVREYYNLTSDPLELTNLLRDNDPRNDPPVAALSAQLAADKQCQGPNCPVATNTSVLPVETAITTRPDDLTGSTKASFTFSSTEPNSTFDCALDGAGFQTCGSSYTTPALSAGAHSLQVRAVDPGGNRDTSPATASWTVDTGAADTHLTLDGTQPRKLSDQSNTTFTFTGSQNAARFNCTLDGVVDSNCTSPTSYSGLADGKHTFSVRAFTNGSRGDPTPPSYSWQVDHTPPTTAILSGPVGTAYGASATIRFKITAPAGESASRFQCKLDSGAYKPCGSPAQAPNDVDVYTTTFTGLADGTHTASVRAVDLAGNVGADSSPYSWQTGALPTFSDLPDTSWPDITAGSDVEAVIADGSGGWYVGGTFTQVGNSAHANIAHIKSDKTVDDAWNPSSDGVVRTMVLSADGNTLYFGGGFTTVDGTTRHALAAVDAHTGALTAWDPSATGDLGASGDVFALALGSSTIYAGGNFTNIKDTSHNKVAEIPLAGVGTPTAWNPPVTGNSPIFALAVSPSSVYVGGFIGLQIGGSTQTLAELDRTTGIPTSWNPNPDHNVRTLALGSSTIFVGGNFVNIGGSKRPKAAELRLDTGTVTDWDPALRSDGFTDDVPQGYAEDLTVLKSTVLIGGNYDFLKREVPRSRLAETGKPDGTATDWNPNLRTQGGAILANSMAFSNGVLAVGGTFTSANGAVRRHLAFYQDDPPDTTILDPKPANPTSKRDATFTFSSSEPGSSFECTLDGNVDSSCTSPKSYSGLANATHTFSVRAFDSKDTSDPTPATYSWTVVNSTYPRPGTGTPLRAPLVPEYQQCDSPNTTHVAPLDKPSCTPPRQSSSLLTMGTTGAGGGFARFDVFCNGGATGELPPCSTTVGDQVDVSLSVTLTDVRCVSAGAGCALAGSGYSGQVLLDERLRQTDSSNGASSEDPGTVQDFDFSLPISCTISSLPPMGSSCSIATTLDALVPNYVKEKKRTIMDLQSLAVNDAGPDGTLTPGSGACPPTCGSGDEKVFMREGVFAP
jgi:arylsulfatase A-like enzyme